MIPKRGKWVNPRKAFVVHPDVAVARWEYGQNPRSIAQLLERREEQTLSGEIYWNTEHDEEMAETARERTQNASARGWKFPLRRKR